MKAQKRAPPRSVDFALGLINLKLLLVGDELADVFPHSFARSFAANVNSTIVHIAYKTVTSVLQLAVKPINTRATFVLSDSLQCLP